MLIETAERTVGACLVTTSSIAVMSAYCWSPPDVLIDFSWLRFSHSVMTRRLPVLVPAYRVVLLVSMPSSVTVVAAGLDAGDALVEASPPLP